MNMQQTAARTATPKRQAISDSAFQTIADHLRVETGIVLAEAKKGLAVSRLSRRLRALDLPNFDTYCALLRGPDGAEELQEMILLLTTNVTRFFREPHHFESLRTKILPDLLAKARAGKRVRIWSAGCSSGEEPYSIAMTILEEFPQAAASNIRILATDVDSNVVRAGKLGRYHVSDEDRAEYPVLAKYLEKVAGTDRLYDVSPSAMELVQFGRLNLQQAWPMKGTFDVIFCRNVVIYFSAETQQILWPRFAKSLSVGGHLMIGHSERVTGAALDVLTSRGVTHYQLKAQGAMK